MASNTDLKWEAAKQADSATTASKVSNSLTIQFNGSTNKTYNGSSAQTVNITPSAIGATEQKRCYVGQSGNSNTKPWYKFAACTVSATFEDRSISFKVTRGYGDAVKQVGILTAHFRTSSTKAFESGELVWEYAASGIDLNDYAMVYKSTANTSTEVQLWVKVDSAYANIHFDVITEHSRSAYGSYFTLYTTSSAGSSASLPSGYTVIYSTAATLKNTATAASHNHSASNITSGTLPVSRGGTGITANPSMLTNLGSTTAAGVFQTSPRPGITGTLAIAHGGTGLTSSPSMLTNLGSTSAANVLQASPRPGITGTLAISHGGTGSTSASAARTALGAAASDHTHDNYFQSRGTLTTESSFDTATKPGWYYVNGAKLSVNGNGAWYGKLRVTYNNDGTIQQELINAWSFFIRDKSGSPSSWQKWIRIDRSIQTIRVDYGNATINSGDAWVGAKQTINYSGLWLISGCTYATRDFSTGKQSGVFQACVSINGVTWLMGNQTINPIIYKPGVGGSIILPLNKGDTIALRIYFACNPSGSVSTYYNRLYAVCLAQD